MHLPTTGNPMQIRGGAPSGRNLDRLGHQRFEGKLIGEGFDHLPLDTLFLTIPLSWKGSLQQYTGRLHRNHVDKEIVRIHDYIDFGYPELERMWQKLMTGYSAMGYQIVQQESLFA